ncbi:hypothetical protein [Crocinitomix catalasitica]|uniref:hypothetical protein n=1 Tax=Crocinitomix catalasitica TaxID=184607 RepID=UPI000488D818|nr:hypothetical protein [Crocinitomix catalasitica]
MIGKIFLIVLIFLGSNTTKACSCDTIAFNDAIDWAEEIFTGHIIKIEAIDTRGDYYGWRWKYTFKVNEKWKGSSDSEVEIYHEGSSCDPYFEIYQSNYLIYASKDNEREVYSESVGFNTANGNLSTWLCARNVEERWENSWFDQDVKRLNKLFPEKVKLTNPLVKKLIWTLIITAIIVLSFIIIRRRKRKLSRIN